MTAPGADAETTPDRAPVWAADIDVDAALAARLIAEQFPALAGATVEPFGIGWDNAAFLIDRRIVFRFPRRRAVTNLIEREIAILPQIATRLPLAISAPSFVGTASAAYPWVFAGYGLIDGSTACSAALPEASRRALAEPLAGFLRALHAIEPAPLVARGLPPDELGRLDHVKRLALTRERLPALTAAGIVADPHLFLGWLAAHPPAPLHEASRRIVHGDLYARHVVLDARGRASGIIDWGDLHLGDPALDIAIAHLLLPCDAHDAFRSAYGPIDERTWNAARYRAIYHAVLELDYGLRENDAGMRQSGSTALQLISPAIRTGAR